MSASQRNPSLDAVRAVAVLGVLITHVVPLGAVSLEARRWADLGARGVDLFFVLSGYLIGGIALREIETSGTLRVKRFWRRRWMRTLPAYYFTLALYGAKHLLPNIRGELRSWPAYVVFLQSYVVGHLDDFAHSWTLCIEEHFYLVLPLLLFVLARQKKYRVEWVMVTIGAVGLTLAGVRLAITYRGGEIDDRLTHWRADGLCAGVLLAALQLRTATPFRLLREHRGAAGAVCAALWALAFWSTYRSNPFAQPATSLACAALVALAAAREPVLDRIGINRAVLMVSLTSYSLYLLHPLVFSVSDMVWRRLAPGNALVLHIVTAIPAALVAGWVGYRLVELSFLRWRDRLEISAQ